MVGIGPDQTGGTERKGELAGAQANRIDTLPPVIIYACGFLSWKKPVVRHFFNGIKLASVRSAAGVPAGSTLAVWGLKSIPSPLAENVKLIRLEDGSPRSVDLGADLIRPISCIGDTRPSDLEHLLATAESTPELLRRGNALRKRIVDSGLTKYNVGRTSWQRPADAGRLCLDELSAWRIGDTGRVMWWRKLFRMALRQIVGVR